MPCSSSSRSSNDSSRRWGSPLTSPDEVEQLKCCMFDMAVGTLFMSDKATQVRWMELRELGFDDGVRASILLGMVRLMRREVEW